MKRVAHGKHIAKFLAVGLWVCIALAVPVMSQDASPKAADASQANSADSQRTVFRLSSGDLIELKFFYDPELNDKIQIRPDGRIQLPLVGDVEFAGKSVEEASKQLEELYAKYLKTPRISIQVREYAGQKVYVTGEVVRPGLVNLWGDLTLIDAIGEAGGIKLTGNKNSIVLIRKGDDGKPVMRKLALQASNGALSNDVNIMLQPYDVVMVPETGIARVDRWVDQYFRQLNPNVSAGFTYLIHGGVIR